MYIRQLESENRKLHTRIAKLEALLFSSESRANALEKQLSKEAKKQQLNVQIVSYADATKGANRDR